MNAVKEPEATMAEPVTLHSTFKAALKPLASLQFTVVLFALCIGLVFFGTVAQIDNGIWTVVDSYFWSWAVMIPLELFAKIGHVFFYLPKDVHFAGKFPFPAGKALAFCLCVNIIAAHLVRFKFTWKRSGVMILHSGLLLLLAGEVITREASLEQRMIIDEGGASSYAFDIRNAELVFGLAKPDGSTDYISIPQSRLRPGVTISDPTLPVDVYVREFYSNAEIKKIAKTEGPPAIATIGIGSAWQAHKVADVSGVASSPVADSPAGYVELRKKGTTESLGTYLVSINFGLINAYDDITADGKTYSMGMRPTRYYKPFRLELIKFKYDRYVGTEKAKNYSSLVRLVDPEQGIDEEILISMNNPLRHRGEAFFQADFDKDTEKQTILQVVHNPGWLLPYASCVVVSLGMFIHFGITLWGFLKRQKTIPVSAFTKWQKRVTWIAPMIVILAFLGVAGRTMRIKSESYNFDDFAKLPVVDGGRVKPIETVARVHLRLMSGREDVKNADGTLRPAILWYLDCTAASPIDQKGDAWKAQVFHIENEHVLGLLDLEKRLSTNFNYTLAEIEPKMTALSKAAREALKKKDTERTPDEAKVIEIRRKLEYYYGFNQLRAPMVVPIDLAKENWKTLADLRDEIGEEVTEKVLADNNLTLEAAQKLRPEKLRELTDQLEVEIGKRLAVNPAAAFWHRMIRAYKTKDPERFNSELLGYREHLKSIGFNSTGTTLESILNRTQPLYYVIGFYVFAVLLSLFGFLIPGWLEPLRRAAFNVLLVTLVIHTAALIARMVIQGRPPVTNLYSSAIYIGWGCALMGVLLERLYRNGVGTLIGAVLGFAGSLVAHNYLGGKDDTLEMLVAVLDTNFWLATHVTCMVFGYVATYVAGAAAIAYLVAVIFVPSVTSAQAKDIARMVYAIVCFSTLLSFVGTVLGGIWADQSWGRFWGWDPKENGAILLVIWNALILHARWAGLVKDRGIAVLTVLGGIITTWSWFGTNQLSVGLHNYGFSSELATLCLGVWTTLAIIAAIGAAVPRTHWASQLRSKA